MGDCGQRVSGSDLLSRDTPPVAAWQLDGMGEMGTRQLLAEKGGQGKDQQPHFAGEGGGCDQGGAEGQTPGYKVAGVDSTRPPYGAGTFSSTQQCTGAAHLPTPSSWRTALPSGEPPKTFQGAHKAEVTRSPRGLGEVLQLFNNLSRSDADVSFVSPKVPLDSRSHMGGH